MSIPVAFPEAERVRKANQAWVEAERAHDLDGIMPYIAENAVFQPPGSKAVRGREAVREFYKEFFKLPFSDFDAVPDEILVAGSADLAMDIGHLCIVYETDGGSEWRPGLPRNWTFVASLCIPSRASSSGLSSVSPGDGRWSAELC